MRKRKEYQTSCGRVAYAHTIGGSIRGRQRVRNGGSRKRIGGLSFNTRGAGENRNVVLGLCNGRAGHVVVDGSPASAAPQVKALGGTRTLETTVRVVVETKCVGQGVGGNFSGASSQREKVTPHPMNSSLMAGNWDRGGTSRTPRRSDDYSM